ncbi:MAG: glycoside hydrolase family 13 protein [Nocardioidaceae bacterium]|nr:glycoside hydrolase family 13 protein [Nocardioidaceae bacterium]NUS53014.1 glycoside hydrolase family 13 protein [Nocardioidaceae bacterium]
MASGVWWRDAVIYQVYIRSFADGDGDGLGDVAGIRSRLGYLADLGVDALWINPWYPSPMADAGYDVSDYRAVEPRFGTLEDAEALVREAHDVGLRVLLDVVPNHSSDQHPWFVEAVEAGPGSPLRDRYVFRPGGGPDGAEPPNQWRSVFGGPAWERVVEPDGTPGEWYLHLFAPEQPDLNWEHPDVAADFEKTLRFWFDRGVDGFRIDVAHSLVKEEGLPDVADVADLDWPRPPVEVDGRLQRAPWRPHPFWDRDEVHDVYRAWRQVADSYADPKVFVAEAWVDEPERLARYLRPDELHTAFNFTYLQATWDAGYLRRVITETLDEQGAVGAPATWVLSNHDVVRHLSRLARDRQAPGSSLEQLRGTTPDLDLGRRRSRAAVLLTLSLPGGAYVYQGEELGLPEVEDLPDDVLQDPTWERSGHTDRGRDGCRVPLPWSGDRPPYGFGPEGGAAPWLPQPDDWGPLTAEAQRDDPGSMLALYRAALHERRALPALGDGGMAWLDLPDGALGFTRDPGFACLVNVSGDPLPLPAGYAVRLASGPLDDGRLPRDRAVWLTRE